MLIDVSINIKTAILSCELNESNSARSERIDLKLHT